MRFSITKHGEEQDRTRKSSGNRAQASPASHIEGPEGVKWELGFACFCTGKMGFRSLGLGFDSEKAKMGMGLVFC